MSLISCRPLRAKQQTTTTTAATAMAIGHTRHQQSALLTARRKSASRSSFVFVFFLYHAVGRSHKETRSCVRRKIQLDNRHSLSATNKRCDAMRCDAIRCVE